MAAGPRGGGGGGGGGRGFKTRDRKRKEGRCVPQSHKAFLGKAVISRLRNCRIPYQTTTAFSRSSSLTTMLWPSFSSSFSSQGEKASAAIRRKEKKGWDLSELKRKLTMENASRRRKKIWPHPEHDRFLPSLLCLLKNQEERRRAGRRNFFSSLYFCKRRRRGK